MIAEILAFLFFATTVTFVILYVMRKRALGNDVKNDLVQLQYDSNPELTKDQINCMVDKAATKLDNDPSKLGVLIGDGCRDGTKSPICSKYLLSKAEGKTISKSCNL